MIQAKGKDSDGLIEKFANYITRYVMGLIPLSSFENKNGRPTKKLEFHPIDDLKSKEKKIPTAKAIYKFGEVEPLN